MLILWRELCWTSWKVRSPFSEFLCNRRKWKLKSSQIQANLVKMEDAPATLLLPCKQMRYGNSLTCWRTSLQKVYNNIRSCPHKLCSRCRPCPPSPYCPPWKGGQEVLEICFRKLLDLVGAMVLIWNLDGRIQQLGTAVLRWKTVIILY